MHVVTDQQIRENVDVLDRAWDDSTTFVLVGSVGSDVRDWLERVLSYVPASLRTGHFGLLTSGSTGLPKLIIGARARAESLVRVLHAVQDNAAAREALGVLPLTYSFAFVNQWLWSRVHGANLRLSPGFSDPSQMAIDLDRAEAAMVCLVGAQVPMLRQYFPDRRFEGITRVHFAGGRFPQESLDFVESLFPNALVSNNYGCTEALPRLTYRTGRSVASALNIGAPIPGVALRNGADEGLEFTSPYRAVAIVTVDGCELLDDTQWIATGDRARPMDDGTWEVLGRQSEVFKRFGEKISLAHVTSVILRRWQERLAFYITTDTFGESAHVLVLERAPTAEELQAVQAELRSEFTRPHWPYRIEHRPIPLLANGKPDVQALQRDGGTIVWRQRY